MWISARDQLPGLGRSCIVWTGVGKPWVAELLIKMDACGSFITCWCGDDGIRCNLNEGHFWIRLPDVPAL